MRTGNYIFVSLILIAVQAILLNFMNFTQLLTVIFIPVIILCLPSATNTTLSILFAFLAGVLVDLFSSGFMGLTSCALMPVALLRKSIITLVCGNEIYSRMENISIRRQGLFKVGVALFFCCLLFFIIFVIADGAGTRPFWFNFVRVTLSSIVSTLLGLVCINILTDRD